jgi:predicted MFS family arabinose efflux permease
MILFATVIVGVTVAWMLGADLRQLDRLDLRGGHFIFAALAVQLLLFLPGEQLAPNRLVDPLHIASYALVGGFIVANLRRTGFWVIALGATLNALVIAVNRGRMPVSLAAWGESGRAPHLFSHGHTFANNVVAGHATWLPWLGDIFALPRWLPLATPISIGDVLIVLGTVVFIYRVCAPRPPVMPHPLRPLASPAFRSLILARVTSSAGDWISLAAIVTWLYARYHSLTAVSLFMGLRILASAVGAVTAARIFPSLGQYRALTSVEAGRGILTALTIPAALTHQAALVIALACISAALASGTRPAAASLIPLIVPAESLQAANAIHGVARNLTMVLATAAAAFSFIHFGIAAALLIDVASFAVAAVAYLAYFNDRHTKPTDHEATEAGSLRYQAHWILRSRVCVSLIACFAAATMGIGLFNAFLPDFLTTQLHQANSYGYALCIIGIGFTVGEFATLFLHRESVARRSVGLACIGTAAALALLSGADALPTAYLALIMLGATDGTTEVIFDTFIQRATPEHLRASVFSLAGATQSIAMTFGFVAAPLLSHVLSPAALVVTAAGACLLAGAIAIAGLHNHPTHQTADNSLHTQPDALAA